MALFLAKHLFFALMNASLQLLLSFLDVVYQALPLSLGSHAPIKVLDNLCLVAITTNYLVHCRSLHNFCLLRRLFKLALLVVCFLPKTVQWYSPWNIQDINHEPLSINTFFIFFLQTREKTYTSGVHLWLDWRDNTAGAYGHYVDNICTVYKAQYLVYAQHLITIRIRTLLALLIFIHPSQS